MHAQAASHHHQPSKVSTAPHFLSTSHALVLGSNPVAIPDVFTIDEDMMLIENVATNDLFLETDTFSIVVNASHGQLTFNPDGSFIYTPDADFVGADSFTYQLCTIANQCSQAVVSIDVQAVNDAPIAVDWIYDVEYNGSLNTHLNTQVLDVEGDVLTYSVLTNVTYGNCVLDSDGSVVYTSLLNYSGWDSLEFAVCDPFGACDTAWAIFIMIDVNESPVAVNDTYTLNEGETLTNNLGENDSDPNGDELSYTLYEAPSHGAVIIEPDGWFTYVPNDYYNGTDEFTYRVCDPTNFCSIAHVYLNITAQNSYPIAQDDIVIGEQNDEISYSVAVNDSDPDGDELTFALVTSPLHGVIVFNQNGSFSYIPDINYYGLDSFQYSACDALLCDTATVTISIAQVNFEPIALDDNYTITQGQVLDANVGSNDDMNNGGSGTYTLSTNASNGTCVLNTDGTFTYTPNPGFYGMDGFIYTVCNEAGFCSDANVTITVIELNTIPVAENDEFTMPEDGFLAGSVAVNDSDQDGDLLTYTLELNVNHGVLTFQSDGSFEYLPNANFFGTDHFTYSVCDTDGNCDVAMVTIIVTPVNDPPQAADDSYTTDEDVAISGFVGSNDFDVDDTQLVYTLGDEPNNGTLEFHSDGTFTYTPDPDFFGTDSFTYTVCDSGNLCDDATVTIVVNEVEDQQPEAVIDQYTTNEDEALQGNVSLNDIGLQAFSYSILQHPAHGQVVMYADGSFIYTPDQDYNGFDEFIYHACNSVGDCYSAVVSIIIVPQPDDDLKIPLGFSPNGDNTNDRFVIENIESYPQNSLTIFNRWGNVVFQKSPYTHDNAWDGTSDVSAVAFGTMVPEGTYYYILDTGPSILNAGKAEQRSGYIVVKYESK